MVDGLDGLDALDWARMQHAYGTAEEVPGLLRELGSPEEEEWSGALSRFYSAVHHQGDVYRCTAASVPFLFALAGDGAVAGRAAVVELLVSIGSSADAVGGTAEDASDLSGHFEALGMMRERAEAFIGFAADGDPLVRRAAIPALGLFVDDAERAVAVLRERLPAEPGVVERLRLVEATADLALRRPETTAPARAWLGALADDRALDPATRLAAVVHRARCAAEFDAEATVRSAVALLREETAPADATTPAPAPAPAPAFPTRAGSAPAHLIAAFEDLARRSVVHSPVTDLLRTFHEVLGARLSARTALLAEQLSSGDPGARLDALRMGGEVIRSRRGDHGPLVTLIADRLADPHPEVVAEAAAVLADCHPVAGPARPALAALVAAQRARHGPQVWAAESPVLRRAHQKAVLALARLGDERALPGLLAALDGGADAWQAVQVVTCLPDAAAEPLVPGLVERLRVLDPEQPHMTSEVAGTLAALGPLGGAPALSAVEEVLDRAVRGKRWTVVCAALGALRRFGPAAAPALPVIRELAALDAAADPNVAPAAIATLWAVGADLDEVLPPALALLDDGISFRVDGATDVLGAIGPAAAAALPRLRELLDHTYEWVRVQGAAALWEIGGEPEAPAVLGALLPAWERNPYTARRVVPCLERMGPAATPAAPLLRAHLELTERVDGSGSIEEDEKLLAACRAALARLG
ncbi:HEAT repeat domain-containing protein [Kitasatospora sp. NPDC004723]|uniref:HEAT repeat domain-containing protein n=1 Tax=Kitasatospora sp. NPDC004723 TaxID=3154288 RepID=UPI0033A1118B